MNTALIFCFFWIKPKEKIESWRVSVSEVKMLRGFFLNSLF
jgi:hypothetical protein